MANVVNFGSSHYEGDPADFNNTNGLTEEALRDLQKSGLFPSDLVARPLEAVERSITNCSPSTRGYVLPYFDLSGEPIGFYRVKVLTPAYEEGAKYKQPRKSENHIYFPRHFSTTLKSWMFHNPHARLLIITEGEKKAAAACKVGLPCIALSGVYSWKTRTISLPKETELTATKKSLRATLPGSDASLPEMSQLAKGFSILFDLITQYSLTIVIIFDSDSDGSLKNEVQRAATLLGYELRYLGIPSTQIKQYILPSITTNDSDADSKIGLDDYLMHSPADLLSTNLKKVLSDPNAFPKHPNPQGFLNTQLNRPLGRKDLQQLSSVLLAELDASGSRYREQHSGKPYFFDRTSHKLIPAALSTNEVLHESPFGTLLYKKFGLTATDKNLLSWLASQFTGEDPISEVQPRRVRTLITEHEDSRNPYGIALQISDSQFIAISPSAASPIEILTNGSKGILFEQNQVDPLDTELLLSYFDEFRSEAPTLEPWWRSVLEDSNLGSSVPTEGDTDSSNPNKSSSSSSSVPDSGSGALDGARMRDYATLLFYISPFLQRWRGIQLPVEIMIGEAGSGKSSLYSMRLQILTGRPHLRNIPNDLKDWNASVTNSGGLLVFDNVHFSKKDLKQQISDEVCRIITEPNPHVELRKYFTTSTLVRIPVDVTFAFTAIQQPFQNADLFQRSAVFELVKLGSSPDGYWVDKQIEKRGGREAWLAHHLVFLHRFLRIASRDPHASGWSEDFISTHRLASLEQALSIAGRILGIHSDAFSPGDTIKASQEKSLSEADWTFEAISRYVQELRNKDSHAKFYAKDIYEWAQGSQEYSDNPILQSSRRIGRYLTAHVSQLASSLYVLPGGLVGNASRYRLVDSLPPLAKR